MLIAASSKAFEGRTAFSSFCPSVAVKTHHLVRFGGPALIHVSAGSAATAFARSVQMLTQWKGESCLSAIMKMVETLAGP